MTTHHREDGPKRYPSGQLSPELDGGGGSQTLDRGLRVLGIVSAAASPMSVAQIAAQTGLHRSVCYRLVRTLEHHDLIDRDDAGRYQPGGGLALLAGRVEPALQTAARPVLQRLADEARMTAFVVVAHGPDVVTVGVIEPRTSVAHVSYRPGARHPITAGAPGLAILAGRPPQPGERAVVAQARGRGWAHSRSEVIEGYRSVAAPIAPPSGECDSAVAVVFAESVDEAALGERVVAAAAAIAARLA